MLRNPFVTVHDQNYQAMNRGDMFVPVGSAKPPSRAMLAATPRMGPMFAHAAPVTYAHPTTVVRSVGNIGMITPNVNGGK